MDRLLAVLLLIFALRCTKGVAREPPSLGTAQEFTEHLAKAVSPGVVVPLKEKSIITTSYNRSESSSGPATPLRLRAAETPVGAASLGGLLRAVVGQEMENCALLVAHDDTLLYSRVAHYLLYHLPNPRQVVLVRSTEDLAGMGWVSAGCGGYIMLLHHPSPLLTYTNTYHDSWDYKGRYVLVCQSVQQLEALVASRNGKKTENILGVIKSGQDGEWKLYMNLLYWGEGVQRVTTWRHHGFTFHKNLFPDKISDLRGAVLKASTFEFPPSIMYYRASNGSLLFRFGEDIAITLILATALNFTVQFAEPSDGQNWGSIVNGNWTGLMGEMTRDQVDIGLAELYIKPDRAAILDFTAPYNEDVRYSFL